MCQRIIVKQFYCYAVIFFGPSLESIIMGPDLQMFFHRPPLQLLSKLWSSLL